MSYIFDFMLINIAKKIRINVVNSVSFQNKKMASEADKTQMYLQI